MGEPPELNELRLRIEDVRRRIVQAAVEAGRDPAGIRLLAAAKQQSADTVAAAIACGVELVGENRVQEMLEKDEEGAYHGAELHFIGRLQRNKARHVVGRVSLIHAGDRWPLLETVEREAAERGIVQDVLLEVNIAGEESKAGFAVEDVSEAAVRMKTLPHVRLRGLMAIPPPAGTPDTQAEYFHKLYNLFLDIQRETGDNTIDVLSMGMSSDFALAVRCGANLVRVGTGIFGARS